MDGSILPTIFYRMPRSSSHLSYCDVPFPNTMPLRGTIALVSDGGRAHFIIDFIYYEIYVPCETHHDCNSHEFLKPSVC